MSRKHKIASDLPLETADSSFVAIPFDTELRWSSPYLSVEDKQWLQDHSDQLPEIVADFLQDLEPSFVFTVKHDPRTSRFLATLVCKNANHEAAARALSFRGSSSFNATVAMAYFVLQAQPDPWWLAVGSTGEGDFG